MNQARKEPNPPQGWHIESRRGSGGREARPSREPGRARGAGKSVRREFSGGLRRYRQKGAHGRRHLGQSGGLGTGLLSVRPLGPQGVALGTAAAAGQTAALRGLQILRDCHGDAPQSGGNHRRVGPWLGDSVNIGTGATLIGKIRIGSGPRLPPNTLVNSGAPQGATVMGVPGRVITQPAPTSNREAASEARERQTVAVDPPAPRG